MNVKTGAEAALFPGKEYLHKWDFRCSVVRGVSRGNKQCPGKESSGWKESSGKGNRKVKVKHLQVRGKSQGNKQSQGKSPGGR